MLVSRDWLQSYFEESLPPTLELVNLLTLHAFEVEGVEEKDGYEVIDVDVLPNRSSDCLNHRGIAREIATLTGLAMKNDSLTQALPDWSESSEYQSRIDAPEAMERFSASVIKGVTVGESPEWLKKRLVALGQRSINNVVDATNYVMFAMGQPTHAFDLDKLKEGPDKKRSIAIRFGRKGETFQILTGEKYVSDEKALHLVDGVSDEILDFAGIKGGKAAELTNETTNIVVTSGNFEYVSVRKTSQRFKLATDASVRFQNEPSRELTMYGLRDVTKLILELAGGELEGYTDWYPEDKKQRPKSIFLRYERPTKLLGTTISKEEVTSILARLSFTSEEVADGWNVTPTFERLDVNIEEDLVEEVGRINGYNNINKVVPKKEEISQVVNKKIYYKGLIQESLIKEGFSEIYGYTFRDSGDIKMENAFAADKSFARKDLASGMVESLERNAHNGDLLGLSVIKLFEFGAVFPKEGEHLSFAFGMRNVKGKKAVKENLFNDVFSSLSEILGKKITGKVIDGVCEINFTNLLGELSDPGGEYGESLKSTSAALEYQPYSVYPSMSRDIALWTEGASAEDVESVLNMHAGDLRVRTDIFDTFEKDGRTSYAFRLVFQSMEKTLTDEEVNTHMDAVTTAVQEKGWEVR